MKSERESVDPVGRTALHAPGGTAGAGGTEHGHRVNVVCRAALHAPGGTAGTGGTETSHCSNVVGRTALHAPGGTTGAGGAEMGHCHSLNFLSWTLLSNLWCVRLRTHILGRHRIEGVFLSILWDSRTYYCNNILHGKCFSSLHSHFPCFFAQLPPNKRGNVLCDCGRGQAERRKWRGGCGES